MADGGLPSPALRVKEGGLCDAALLPLLRDRINGFFQDVTIRHVAKPSFALLVPASFEPADPAHQGELGLALGLAAQLLPGHRFDVLAGAELGSVLDGTSPLRPDALGEQLRCYSFALCVLDRRLAQAAAAHLPVRLVGSDPAALFPDKQRITFWDPQAAGPAGERLAPERLQGAPVWLMLDPFMPLSAARALVARLGRAGVSPALVLPPQASARLRAALAEEIGRPVAAELPSPPPEGAVLCATDRFALHLASWPLPVLVRPEGELEVLAPPPQPLWAERINHVLYRGEELNALLVLDRLLGLGDGGADGPLRHLRRPLISIVVPVYDRTSEIARLARSLFRQDYPHLEVLFVANGSPPQTLEALREAKALLTQRRLKVRLLTYPQPFGCATLPRDIGAYAARGEFLCFVDSDDYLEDGFFDDFLREPMDENAIYYPGKIFRDGGRDMGPGFPFNRRLSGPGAINSGLYEVLHEKGNLFNNSGTMVSRKHFLRAGGIWHKLRYAEDYYLWLRVARAGARALEHGGAVSITLHPGNNELRVGDARWVELAKRQAERGVA